MAILTLSGRVAIVTGAAQGIGFHTAKMMCREGMKVALIDSNTEKLGKATEQLTSITDSSCAAGAVAVPFTCDVSDDNAIEKTVNEIATHFGQIDVLVNSAGILSVERIPDIKRENWDHLLAVNLSGSFFMVQKALPYLKQSKHGRVINISSVASRKGGGTCSMTYNASKGGISAITRGLARQLAPFGITVNAVAPGIIDTPIQDAYTKETLRETTSQILLGRMGDSDDVAAGICYLVSEEAGYVTGVILDINGGFWIG